MPCWRWWWWLCWRQISAREERLRRITERPAEEEEEEKEDVGQVILLGEMVSWKQLSYLNGQFLIQGKAWGCGEWEEWWDRGRDRGWQRLHWSHCGILDQFQQVAKIPKMLRPRWTLTRLHTVNNLACLAWAQQIGLPSFLGPGHTVVDFGCGSVFFFLSFWLCFDQDRGGGGSHGREETFWRCSGYFCPSFVLLFYASHSRLSFVLIFCASLSCFAQTHFFLSIKHCFSFWMLNRCPHRLSALTPTWASSATPPQCRFSKYSQSVMICECNLHFLPWTTNMKSEMSFEKFMHWCFFILNWSIPNDRKMLGHKTRNQINPVASRDATASDIDWRKWKKRSAIERNSIDWYIHIVSHTQVFRHVILRRYGSRRNNASYFWSHYQVTMVTTVDAHISWTKPSLHGAARVLTNNLLARVHLYHQMCAYPRLSTTTKVVVILILIVISFAQEDLAFLNGKVAIATVFTVLHLLPSVLQVFSPDNLTKSSSRAEGVNSWYCGVVNC